MQIIITATSVNINLIIRIYCTYNHWHVPPRRTGTTV